MLIRVVVLGTLFLAAGCAFRATDLPNVAPRPPSHDRVYVLVEKSQTFPGSTDGYWSIASGLGARLENAGFVPTLLSADQAVPPDAVVIDSIDPGGECFSEPMLTVLTAGVIPHVGCQEGGYRSSLRDGSHRAPSSIDAHLSVRAFWGWLTWPLAIGPSYVSELSMETMREQQVNLLRAAVQDALRGQRAAQQGVEPDVE